MGGGKADGIGGGHGERYGSADMVLKNPRYAAGAYRGWNKGGGDKENNLYG